MPIRSRLADKRPCWFTISRYVYHSYHIVATQSLASPLLPVSGSSNRSQPLHPLRSMHTHCQMLKCSTRDSIMTSEWTRRSFQTHCPGKHSQPIKQTHLSGHFPWQLPAVWITWSLNDTNSAVSYIQHCHATLLAKHIHTVQQGYCNPTQHTVVSIVSVIIYRVMYMGSCR